MRDISDKPNHSIIWTSVDRGVAFWIMNGNVYYAEIDGTLSDVETLKRGEIPSIMLIENANIRSIQVQYYGWWRGASGFDKSLSNRIAVIANSIDHVYVYFMDAQSLEVLDAKKKRYPSPITHVESYLALDGSLKLMIMPESGVSNDLSEFFVTHSIRK